MKELPLKQWCAEEAIREGVSEAAISNRLYRGGYPHLKLRRVNKRIVFVSDDGQRSKRPRKQREPKQDKRTCEGCGEPHGTTMLRAPAKRRLCFACWVGWLAKNETEANERQK